MARISRVVASGYPHHVTQRGVRFIPIFQADSNRKAYLDFMAEELNRFGVEVLAWCLMTNHTHLIVVPQDSAVLARAIGEAHRRYTRMKNFSDGVRGYLFQGRFGSCVLDEHHLLAAARYVELNPVNAGIVKEAAEYPWSSARFHLGLSQGDALVRDKSLLGLVNDWGEYLRGDDEPRTQTMLLRGIRTGRPAGNEQFVEMIERLTGRHLAMRKAGRPLKRVS
jgi:REP-associated tyrosine transposase